MRPQGARRRAPRCSWTASTLDEAHASLPPGGVERLPLDTLARCPSPDGPEVFSGSATLTTASAMRTSAMRSVATARKTVIHNELLPYGAGGGEITLQRFCK